MVVAEAILIRRLSSLGKWKTKSSKKLSVRELLRREHSSEMDRIENETHYRFGFDMGFPCVHFGVGAVCGIDKLVCDLETEKGRKFLRDYECEDCFGL